MLLINASAQNWDWNIENVNEGCSDWYKGSELRGTQLLGPMDYLAVVWEAGSSEA